MKSLFSLLLVLSSLSTFATNDPYTCISKSAAKAILTANLGQGFHNASTSEQQDWDEEISYYANGLMKDENGYIALPNNYFQKAVFVSCLGVFEER